MASGLCCTRLILLLFGVRGVSAKGPSRHLYCFTPGTHRKYSSFANLSQSESPEYSAASARCANGSRFSKPTNLCREKSAENSSPDCGLVRFRSLCGSQHSSPRCCQWTTSAGRQDRPATATLLWRQTME